ncbi:amino acid ABC transporter substrate-binding protein (PAAT family) /amino acid ABC transporter membrane protein (PAAT family) [Yimella lutea]|uniref:Amino acid ABC transporter substrate-binding protein (PAAT family) /amino acid ABC transporter membrane protein (PAAT family) n=1 Tax=Yimella lutea TaxID=587872 RepID=A0A542EDG1_9MICO|nr:amino acid ABC transporter substrate-binding protein (PAAT family) /amino acid ABC transporter membrane protein (PAAT family) [Yimella lutea]
MRSITSRTVAALAAVLVVLATLLGSGGTAAAAPAPTSVQELPKVLRVGTEGVYPPFSYHQGNKLTGYDVEFMEALGRKAGVRIQFVEVPWDSMFAALSSGRIDVVANQVTKNPEREGLYDLSTPYIETTGVVVVAEDDDSVKKLSDIKGKRAGQNLTSNWAQTAKANGAQVVGVDSMDKAIQNLRQGSVDVVVNDKLAVRNFLATTDNPGVKIVAETDDKSESVLAARKNSGYVPALNKGINELKADGTSQRLYDKYFNPKAEPITDWKMIRENAWPMAWAAIKVTIPLTIISFVIGLIIALGVAIARMSTNPLAFLPARLFISIFRGIPVLVLLLLIYFGLPQFGWKLAPFTAAVIGFSLNVAGYGAEIIRAAIQSVPRGQWEAARTIGMDHRTTLRRVIIPQAARTAVPPLSNTLIDLVKSTSLASAILVVELLRQAQIAAAPTFKFFTLYSLAALYYWLISVVLSFFQARIEKRVSRFVA